MIGSIFNDVTLLGFSAINSHSSFHNCTGAELPFHCKEEERVRFTIKRSLQNKKLSLCKSWCSQHIVICWLHQMFLHNSRFAFLGDPFKSLTSSLFTKGHKNSKCSTDSLFYILLLHTSVTLKFDQKQQTIPLHVAIMQSVKISTKQVLKNAEFESFCKVWKYINYIFWVHATVIRSINYVPSPRY